MPLSATNLSLLLLLDLILPYMVAELLLLDFILLILICFFVVFCLSSASLDESGELLTRSPDPVSASEYILLDPDQVKVSFCSFPLVMTRLAVCFKIPCTFLVVDFLSSLGGVSSVSVSDGASESLSVSESLVFLALVGDFFDFCLLPLFLLCPFRSVLALLSLLSLTTFGLPNLAQHLSGLWDPDFLQ